MLLPLLKIASSAKCDVDFKVYVYQLPPHLLEKAEQARRNQTYHVCRGCLLESLSLEYVMYDYFTTFCGRVKNPNDADFFYLPIAREIEYRIELKKTGNRLPSPTERAILEAMEKNSFYKWKEVFNVTDYYWRRRNGADHIIIMPAAATNIRHQSGMRGYFHYVSYQSFLTYLCMPYSPTYIVLYT